MSKGDLTTVLDNLTFDNARGFYPLVIHIGGDIFAVAYQNLDDSAIVATFTIDKDGNVGAAVIDTQDVSTEPENGRDPVIRRVSGSTYAVLYDTRTKSASGSGAIRIATLTINPDGTIDNTLLDQETLGPNTAKDKDFINISGEVWAIAFESSGIGQGSRILTRTITALGIIGTSDIDLFEIDSTDSFAPSIVQVSGTMYAVAYGQFPVSPSQVVTTIVIENDGQIAAAITATEVFILGRSGNTKQVVKILKVSGTTYALAYVDTDEDGKITTITISDAGAITSTVINTLEFETSLALDLDFIQIAGDLYAVAYSGVGGDGFIKSFNITKQGVIGLVLATLEFEINSCDDPTLIVVPDSKDIVAIVYNGLSLTGVVKTLGVTTLLAGYIWIEGEAFHYTDENKVERFVIGARDDHASIESVSAWLGL